MVYCGTWVRQMSSGLKFSLKGNSSTMIRYDLSFPLLLGLAVLDLPLLLLGPQLGFSFLRYSILFSSCVIASNGGLRVNIV